MKVKIILSALLIIFVMVLLMQCSNQAEANKDISEVIIAYHVFVYEDKKDKLEKKLKNDVKSDNKYRYDDEYELYTATAYSNHFASTGKNPNDPAYGITYSGTKTTEGRTVACDKSKLGLKVYIPYFDNVFICEDIGASITGNRIDIYFEREEDALEFGRKENFEVKFLDKEANNE